MRHGRFLLLMLLSFTMPASAQQPMPAARNGALVTASTARAVVATATLDDVVARLMSFDRDRDRRVAQEELPERMQDLLHRGDSDHDGTLDDIEIQKLAITPASTFAGGRGFVQPFGGYTFGDEFGLSSRSHVEGALEDLRLAGETREQAFIVARAFLDSHEAEAFATLDDLRSVLSPEQLTTLKASLDRSQGSRVIPIPTPPSPDRQAVRRAVFLTRGFQAPAELSGLPPAQTAKVFEAVVRFRDVRVDDADRAALVEGMTGILTEEERDNFRAALERRPLVKAGGIHGVVAGIRGNAIVPPGNPVARPAVLITPLPQAEAPVP